MNLCTCGRSFSRFSVVFRIIIQNKRDPVANFMSSWKYYHGLTKEMRLLLEIPPIDGNEKTPDFIPEMEKFLKDPWTYLNPWPYSHSAYLFTVNPQLIFFGNPRYVLDSTPYNAKYFFLLVL